MTKTHSGYVALIGKPNVGKSTLLNSLIGQKISITSRKPQTTRHRILGIQTLDKTQILYVDTPGLHVEHGGTAINRYMNRAAVSVIRDVDVIVFMTEGLQWSDEDEYALKRVKQTGHPVILAINKIDQIKAKEKLLPHLKMLSEKMEFKQVIPISAKNNIHLYELVQAITDLMPEGPHFYPAEQISDRNERFMVAEIIREKLFRTASQELPYSTTVEIEEFKLKKDVYHIAALIWVEREGQKKIYIGTKGEKLKRIGQQARLDIEKLLGKKVFLQLWVKVKKGWSDDTRALRQLGYED